jgi:hypothetical protein
MKNNQRWMYKWKEIGVIDMVFKHDAPNLF